MVVVIAAAAVAVLAAVVVLAMGRGGELAEVHPDHPPLRLPSSRPLVGTDIALLRLPKGLWGYHVSVTDDALRRMAYALTERDALVGLLQQRLAEVQQASATADVRSDASWFAEPAGHGSEPAHWVPPAEFGHGGDSRPQDYGPRPVRGNPYEARHEIHTDAVPPEDQ